METKQTDTSDQLENGGITAGHWLAILVAIVLLAGGGYWLSANGPGRATPATVEPNMAHAEPGPAQRRTQQDVRMNEIKLQRLVRSWVVAGLKDPDSAKFRNQYGVCGEVNAKNAMGGYVGYRRFIAARKDLVFVNDGITTSPSDFEKVWTSFCDSSPTGSARLPE